MSTRQVSVKMDEAVFQQLKGLAEPLVDDVDTVITRLINHWKQHPPRREAGPRMWTSARGEQLPIGLKLRATYMRKTAQAEVAEDGIRYNGQPYASPSRAAIAAKHALGAQGAAANQNGWDFWEYYDEAAKSWRSLRSRR